MRQVWARSSSQGGSTGKLLEINRFLRKGIAKHLVKDSIHGH
jgi:hypothetical protein